ncbi:opsin, ultraviolet-sensitive-like [Centruroides vittatus]|uniref:opsin, ultraviolet-sensitive-like n=1 Tax=Centruroides vittatus TaxID=120091 RepID=UPI00350F32A1
MSVTIDIESLELETMLLNTYQQADVNVSNLTSSEYWENVLNPEFLAIVPHHWLQFPIPDARIQFFFGMIYIFILIPGIGANSLIVFLFFKIKSLRTPSNFLVFNLAVSDLMMNCKMPLFIYNSFSLGPATGLWGCQLYGFVGGLSGTCAILTISAMAFERYNTISNPLDSNVKMSKSKAYKILIFIWIYALNFCIPPLFGLNRYVPEGYLTSCSFDYLDERWLHRGFVLVFFVAAWCIPLVIICWCYLGILIKVRNHEKTFTQQERRMTLRKKVIKKYSTEIRLAKISFGLISLWFVAWTPYAVVALTGAFFDRKLLTPLTSMIPALFCKSASVVDPFVYGLTHPKFKIEIKRLVKPCRKNKDEMDRSNLRSTKSMQSISSENIEMDFFPESIVVDSNECILSEIEAEASAEVSVYTIPVVDDVVTRGEEVKTRYRRSI